MKTRGGREEAVRLPVFTFSYRALLALPTPLSPQEEEREREAKKRSMKQFKTKNM